MPSPGEKYLGAWAETSARIQARDNVLLAFIALATALIGLSLSKDGFQFASVAIGFAALATALLTCHHDIIIGYLNAYQLEVSKADKSAGPEWFSGEHFRAAIKYRTVRDVGQALIILLGGAGGLSAATRGCEATAHARTSSR